MSGLAIQLRNLQFATSLVTSPRTLFRINENSEHKYQPEEPRLVHQGRFNVAGQYCFYLALHPTAAVLEVLSYKPELTTGVLHSYELRRDLKLLNLTRFQFPTPPSRSATKVPYSFEELVVNQYVTCPRGEAFPWAKDGNHAIGAYARTLGVDGILYQTSIGHLIRTPEVFFSRPTDLLNVALFFEPNEAGTILQHASANTQEINPAFRERYRREIAERQEITRRLLCHTFEETAMLSVGSVPWTGERHVRPLA